MKHVIIGMAGHVDHGKTELVKALTGVDTDRLAEEKKRGITIDLGFACLDFPDGSCASIVDVPGHERFIKNMLAGAGGVDLAMLVVAADEGFMPQTVEHLDILQLLGVKDGLIVLTKTDLVDEDWLNMLEEDVKSRVKGTFLEDKPILRTSVRTGEGIEALREALHDLTLHAEEKSARTPFRLPIDRVFSVDGFGTIVTGTLIDGHIAVGDEAQLMPLGNQCRVRNLQVHGRDVSAVYAGQRAAVNLAGIKKESISRGDVLFDIVPDALDDMEGGDGHVYMQEDGILLSVTAESGTQAAKDAVLATYCPKDAMLLVCSVDEQDIAEIQVGDVMTVTLDAYEDKPLRGVVTKIAAAGEDGGAFYDVTLELEENDLMRIGMSASAEK